MLTRLIHPDTGEEVLTSENGVDALVKTGYAKPDSSMPKKKAEKKDAKTTAKTSTGTGDESKPQLDEGALKKMKLTELIDHAEQCGLDPDTLEIFSKPGTSKASVIAAIQAKQAEGGA